MRRRDFLKRGFEGASFYRKPNGNYEFTRQGLADLLTDLWFFAECEQIKEKIETMLKYLEITKKGGSDE